MPRSDLRLFDEFGYTLEEVEFRPTAVRGPDAVAQRFVYYLLTPTGSVPGQPEAGSDFLSAARTFRSEFDLFAAFAAAEPAVSRSVRACELSTDDPSEKYGFARLSGIDVNTDEVTLTLYVAAADGSTPSEPVAFSVQP